MSNKKKIINKETAEVVEGKIIKKDENNPLPTKNNMINISYQKIIKRVLAYMIDILIVTIIASLITYIPIINKQFDKYQTIYDEYKEIYSEYTNTIILLNDSYEDKEITEEEYQSLLEKERYSSIIESKYSDQIITQEEHEEITSLIEEEYSKIAQDYNYKLQKNSIYNSIITLICTLLYFGVLQYFLKGESIGKKIMHLKIVSANGKKINILNYLLRSLIVNNVFLNGINILFLAFTSEQIFSQADQMISLLISIIEAIIIFLIITREDNRGLHDLLCNTKVISTKE